MSSPELRKRYNVGAWKLPYAERDVAHAVITDVDDHGFFNILGADTADNDDKFPIGAKVAYTVHLTDREVDAFIAASNCRYVEEDRWYDLTDRSIGRVAGTVDVLSLSTLAWQRSRYVDLATWHGRDVRVAVLDSGTTAAMRSAMGFTLVGQTNVTGDSSSPFGGHGTVCASTAVPVGGQLLDGKISTTGIQASWFAAGVRWAVDNGAKVISASVGGGVGTPPQSDQDVFQYAMDNGGVQIVAAAGNDNVGDLASPSSGSRLFSNVHSSIAFDESTDRKAPFSNYNPDGSGCGPGVDVLCVGDDGALATFNGTSASTPAMVHLMARALTGGRFTPAQVGAAFKNNPRNTGASSSNQGHGAYDLQLALSSLGAVPRTSTTTGPYTASAVDTRGLSGFVSGVNVTTATGIVAGDVQLVFLVSSFELSTLTGTAGWQVICDHPWPAGWESGPIGKTRVRVLARIYAEGDPSSSLWNFNGEVHDCALAIMTLRGAFGIDPAEFVPIARFGDAQSVSTGSPTTVSVLPNTANDLQISMFAQRQETAATSASLSVPTGLTDRGFYRPTGTRTLGYAMRMATRQLTDGNRTPIYTSTSNDPDGTWVSVALTIPSSNVEPPPTAPPPEQELPQGPTSGVVAFMPHA
jgi:hypothetical protein